MSNQALRVLYHSPINSQTQYIVYVWERAASWHLHCAAKISCIKCRDGMFGHIWYCDSCILPFTKRRKFYN